MSLTVVKTARELMEKVFDGKVRKYSGAPYFVHLDRVARKVAHFTWADDIHIVAAYLHDWPEDFGKTFEEQESIFRRIESMFGEQVALIVRGLTNVSVERKGLPRAARKKLDRERLATNPIWAVKAIKLIDRIDNVRESAEDLRAGLATDHAFHKIYADESSAMLEAVRGTVHPDLERELESMIEFYRKVNVLSQRK